MRKFATYRQFYLGSTLLLLLTCLTGCSRDEAEPLPRLNIYVYAPDRPTVTRSEVVPTEEEAKVHNLNIWVFRSNAPKTRVASLSLNSESDLAGLNQNKSASYSLEITDRNFALNPEPVDIYVMANVSADNSGTDYGVTTTESSALDAALFNGGPYYSYTANTDYQAATSVSANGIPMSGVARGKSVTDNNNVLHVNDANLKLVRGVSKIRFVFSSLAGEEGEEVDQLYIDGITLDNKMLYTKEHLFLNTEHPDFWVEDAFDQPVQLVPSDLVNPVAQNDDPTAYSYSSTMTESEYEAKIDEWLGLEESPLTQKGIVYLPESDQKLTGTIYFRLSSDMSPTGRKSATFSMVAGDFRRNQTWIVYAYYIGSSKLEVNTVNVVNWKEEDDMPEHDIHNF